VILKMGFVNLYVRKLKSHPWSTNLSSGTYTCVASVLLYYFIFVQLDTLDWIGLVWFVSTRNRRHFISRYTCIHLMTIFLFVILHFLTQRIYIENSILIAMTTMQPTISMSIN